MTLALVAKATVLLGVIAVAQLTMLRRTSAAVRHLVWTLAVAGTLLLPVLAAVLPEWTAVAWRFDAPAESAPFDTSSRSNSGNALAKPDQASNALEQNHSLSSTLGATSRSIPWVDAVAGGYAAGVFVMLMGIAGQQQRLRRLAGEAIDVTDRDWLRLSRDAAAVMGVRAVVRLLRSPEGTMPMTFGVLRPTILLPAVADTWSEDRRRAVVLHEMAHVARRDCLTQFLACAACTLYWFHPALWWTARRLRIERELACDDRVVLAGAHAPDYAGHLLEIAYSLDSRRAPALGVTMAQPQQLEYRMLAVLDRERNRYTPQTREHAAGVAIAAIFVALLASATSTVGATPVVTSASTVGTPAANQISPAAPIAIGEGTWEIHPSDTEGQVRLRIAELNSSSTRTISLSELEGITGIQLKGATGPVHFTLRRDAGTFTFDGVMRNGVGAGTFSFATNPNFPAELAKRGFATPTAAEQYQLARNDIGYAYIDELTKLGYGKPQTSELVRAGQHGVNLPYLRDMGALGYRLGRLDALVQLRDHGVTPSYVRELAAFGYKNLAADEIQRARDHGVTSDYVRAMRDAGYGSLPIERLINARDHGVNGEYVRGLAESGHRNLPLDQVVRARDHGVTVEYARELAALGYGQLPLDTLVRMRDHGVTSDYVKGVAALGYGRITADDLVRLRNHGMTPDRIRSANGRAGRRLDVDQLIKDR